MNVITSEFTVSRNVLLLTKILPCVFAPCITTLSALPIREPESFVPCVPITLPSTLPTIAWLAGPVAAPAAVAMLMAWLLWPVIVVLLRIWKATFATCDWLKSMAMLLLVKVLVCTVKLLEAAGATIAPPEDDPILPVSDVETKRPVPLTPLKVQPVTEPLVSTDVPRICTKRPLLPIDPLGWQALPTTHWAVVFVITNPAMLVLRLSTNIW